jgi:2-haloacid dehalogenase
MNYKPFTTLTFDCYGTLIDWESGIWDGFQPLLAANSSTMTRHQLLGNFAIIESTIQAETPGMIYSDVLTEAHRRFALEEGLKSNDEMNARFGQFVPYWPAFPDSADALRLLKQHFRLVILSNVNRAGFAASNERLGVRFDAIYTAEDVGSYKPDPANFSHMLTRLDADHAIPGEAVLHVAQSLFHDIQPARAAGLPTVWIDRQNLRGGGSWGATARTGSMPQADITFDTMMDFAKAACA